MTDPAYPRVVRVLDVTRAARLEDARALVLVAFGLLGSASIIALLVQLVVAWGQPLPHLASLLALLVAIALSSTRGSVGAVAAVLLGGALAVFFVSEKVPVLAVVWTVSTGIALFATALAVLRSRPPTEAIEAADAAAVTVLTEENVAARKRSIEFRGRSEREPARRAAWEVTADTLRAVGLPLVFATRALFFLASIPRARARELGTPDAEEHKRRDGRPPALWLRPFTAEDIPLEHVAGHWLELLGPFIAVKNPRDARVHTAQAAAARAVLGDAAWATWVAGELREARAIGVVAGASEGVITELQLVAKLNALAKTLVLFSSRGSPAERARTWDTAVRHLGLVSFDGIERVDPARVVAVVEQIDCGLLVMTSRDVVGRGHAIAAMIGVAAIAGNARARAPVDAAEPKSRLAPSRWRLLGALALVVALVSAVTASERRTQAHHRSLVADRARIAKALLTVSDRAAAAELIDEFVRLDPPDVTRTLVDIAEKRKAARPDAVALAICHASVTKRLHDMRSRKAASWWSSTQKAAAQAEEERLRWLNKLFDATERRRPGTAPKDLTSEDRRVISCIDRSFSKVLK